MTPLSDNDARHLIKQCYVCIEQSGLLPLRAHYMDPKMSDSSPEGGKEFNEEAVAALQTKLFKQVGRCFNSLVALVEARKKPDAAAIASAERLVQEARQELVGQAVRQPMRDVRDMMEKVIQQFDVATLIARSEDMTFNYTKANEILESRRR